MKQTLALVEMLSSRECALTRDRADGGEADRLRTRERLEATLAGLGELEYLRQRQELLVRGALSASAEERSAAEESYLNTEEKLLEENILLLRKQLNCLRRRDAGLISQLQELDRQISDLRLDTETSHEHVETDSRPSSGFYELSDGVSGSLSNSSNSVFSECLSSCPSSTCFCSPLDTSLCASEIQPKSADEGGCADCEGRCEDQNSGTVRRSLSAPYSPSLDSSLSDVQSKYHCDLIAKNGNDIYRYPSPLHAVAVQSPIFFQSLTNQLKDDGGLSKSGDASGDGQKSEQPLVSQGSHLNSNKKLDSYIYGLIQRRTQPMRTNKPRTSINTDPSKSILRQASLCVRQAANTVPNPSWNPDLKPSWQTFLQNGTLGTADTSMASPQKQWSVETKGEAMENVTSYPLAQPQNGFLISQDVNSNSLLKKKNTVAGKCQTLKAASHEPGSPNMVSSPKRTKHPYFPTVEDNKSSSHLTKAATPKKSPKCVPPATALASGKEERSTLEQMSLGSSSQSQDEGGNLVSAQYIPAHKQSLKLRKGGNKHIKIIKVKNSNGAAKPAQSHTEPVSEVDAVHPHTHRERHRSGTKKSRYPEDSHASHSHRSSKKSSSRTKRIPPSIPEGQILEKPVPSAHRSITPRHHGHHGREAVVIAKPKYKRSDYRRLRSIPEVSYEEAFKRAHRRQKREFLNRTANMYLPSNVQFTSPYAYVGSDSEYSAECASLFHSTIMDTSEDERSNYTTNRFGDSESSCSEADFAGESTTTSDSEESGRGKWSQFRQGPSASHIPQEMTSAQAKAFVKIKASHNLKKKILRFRSGSLKLMTTV
ncbi:dapper homolog 1 [Denticeps clupeoides]|uniref:Dapper homolog 1 n=1 Tax=Denticeps clupeoides TaxID=299321 RepID=A0AAY3ZUI4_9TELE|nr:dapper homolog 1 [Denticeps clupeoides]